MKKRVLMAATVPSMIGQFNMDNIRMLLEMGYEVDVAADFTDTSVWPVERIDNFRALMHEMGIECIQLDFSRNPLDINRHIRSYEETLMLIRKRKYTFIHTHTPIASAIIRLAAKKTGTRVIYTAHGFHFFDGAPLKNWLIFYPVEWWLSRYTDVLVTINKEDYNRACRRFHAKKTVRIPGVGVDTNKFAVCKVDKAKKRAELGVAPDDFLLLSVGELSERKNPKVVIDALGRMKADGTIGNIVYLLVGKGDQEETLRCLTKTYAIGDHVRFLGYRTDIDELCETVDCFVHPSIREGLGIAPLEAMAAGLPLISANVNGIKDYTENNVTGCCIDPMSVDEMVSSILHMRDDPAFRAACGSNNWKRAKSFDIRNTNAIMESVYKGGYRHIQAILTRQEKRAEFGFGLDDRVVVSVGEVNDNKNHQVIIRALTKVPGLKYVLVGKGVLQEQMRALADSLGLSDRVVLAGYRTDIREILLSSDCFAFPSKREGLGIAALEGMAAGLPVIGHDIGGIQDYVIDGQTGWLCREEDDYVRALSNCLEFDGLRFSKKCSDMALQFDIERTNSIMKEIYEENASK